MRVLIVDDEPAARARLRRLLSAQSEVQVLGEAADGHEALDLVNTLAPDALFLDIQMPGMSGLDVAASLADPAPAVVFVTAYDRYALEAFDASALDYLLKPVDGERLQRALSRLSRRLQLEPDRRLPSPPKLLVPDRGRTHVIAVADIVWLEAADNYVAIHTSTGAPLLRRTLSALLADLGDGFVRVHRSAAVSLAKVTRLVNRESGDATVVLSGNVEVPCSRQYRAELLDWLAR